MSWWTYVTGSVRVSVPGRSQPEIQYILDTVLEHLPRVTGSEEDMHVHAVREDGFRCSSSCDEFGMRTNNLKDEYGCRTRRHGMMHTQSYYVIALEGYLRDRYLNETKKEFMKWLCRLAKRVIVEDVLVRIWDYESEFLLNERDRFSDMWESPSWGHSNTDSEPAWWEFMCWERHPNSDMPLSHVFKYVSDEETDKEMDRRERWRENFER